MTQFCKLQAFLKSWLLTLILSCIAFFFYSFSVYSNFYYCIFTSIVFSISPAFPFLAFCYSSLSLQCINFYIIFFLHLPPHVAPSMFFSFFVFFLSLISFTRITFTFSSELFYFSILNSILSLYFHFCFIILVSS